MTTEEKTTANTGLAKVAVQCSADTFVVNQSLVLRINICGENRHLRQAPKRCSAFKKNETIDKIHRKEHIWKKGFRTFYPDKCRLYLYADRYHSENNEPLERNKIVGYDANGV